MSVTQSLAVRFLNLYRFSDCSGCLWLGGRSILMTQGQQNVSGSLFGVKITLKWERRRHENVVLVPASETNGSRSPGERPTAGFGLGVSSVGTDRTPLCWVKMCLQVDDDRRGTCF